MLIKEKLARLAQLYQAFRKSVPEGMSIAGKLVKLVQFCQVP